MESDLLKYTHEYDLQNKLKALKILNAKVAKCNSDKSGKTKVIYEITIQDDEILDPVRCRLSDDEESWLYVPEECVSLNTSIENANRSSRGGKSIWEWLGFSLRDIQLSNLYSNNASFNNSASSPSSFLSGGSPISSIKEQLLPNLSSDQGLRKNIVDSRTYTRPKKRTFQTIIGRCLDETVTDENACGQPNNSQLTSTSNQIATSHVNAEYNSSSPTVDTSTKSYLTALSSTSTVYASPSSPSPSSCTSSLTTHCSGANNNINNNSLTSRTNCTLTTSLGIIDIDQLTNSQLGFNNVLDPQETPSSLGCHPQNHLLERKGLSPFIGSDYSRKTNGKYKLDDTFNLPVAKTEVLTNTTNSTNGSKLTNMVISNRTTISSANNKSKFFNTTANELLQISFPRGYINADSPSLVGDGDTLEADRIGDVPVTDQNDTFSASRDNIPVGNRNSASCINKNNTTCSSQNETTALINDFVNVSVLDGCEKNVIVNNIKDNKFNHLNSDETLTNPLETNRGNTTFSPEKIIDESRVQTPPQQLNDFSSPVGFSTPVNTKTEIRRKGTYDAITNRAIIQENGIGNGGRLSDSSTDTDLPSISMEDLTEDQVSPILNQTYNTSTTALSNSQNEKSALNRTYEMAPQLAPSNATRNLTINKSHNAVNNSGLLNSTFRKSPLSTTFCKSSEALNGGIERSDSGPEDDCMSTASDSSFSSSSTHMRSVGEIQSIARLQEESLRQQAPRKKMAWSGSGGLAGTTLDLRRSVPKLSTDDGNQSDHSDRSSDRYSPTTLNNNDRGDKNVNEKLDSRTISLSSRKSDSCSPNLTSSDSDSSFFSIGLSQTHLTRRNTSSSYSSSPDEMFHEKQKSCCCTKRGKKRCTSSKSPDSLRHGKRKNNLSPYCDKECSIFSKKLLDVCLDSQRNNYICENREKHVDGKSNDLFERTDNCSTSPVNVDEANDKSHVSDRLNKEAGEQAKDSIVPKKFGHVLRRFEHRHDCIKLQSASTAVSDKVAISCKKSPRTANTVTAELNPGVCRNRSPRGYTGLKKFGGSSELYPSTGIPQSGNTASTNYDYRKQRLTGLRPPTMFGKVSTQSAPPASVTAQPSCVPAVPSAIPASQPSLPRPSGIRPPSVIPRPVSRLPAPKIRSGLAKYYSQQGKQ